MNSKKAKALRQSLRQNNIRVDDNTYETDKRKVGLQVELKKESGRSMYQMIKKTMYDYGQKNIRT
jgi:outer membrane lipopolysaccharide assembly protein LptE/RlpB